MSWYKESFRHSLAGKGISSSMLGKKSQIIDRKFGSTLYRTGVPSSEQVNVVFQRLQHPVRDLPEDELRGMSEEELQRRLVEEMTDFEEREKNLRDINKMVEARKAAKAQVEADLLYQEDAYPMVRMGFASKKDSDDDEWDEVERAYMNGEIDEPTYLRRLNDLSEKKKQSMAGKNGDLFGSADEHPLDYINRSVAANNERGFERFWSGVKSLAWHPLEELDKDWLSYERAAKLEPRLSSDPYERSVERGAALFGRVVTMSNVEPLIDHEEDMNVRQALLDIEFGRRSD